VPRFLAERAGALRDPNLVVVAFDAPYYLDATEISKLSAYYVAYSHVDPFMEASARALFGEFGPTGAPPVSVPGIGYSLAEQVLPDPEQTITLEYTAGEPLEEGEPMPTPQSPGDDEPTPEPPEIQVGTALRMRTSPILDHNGNPVPDGTPVQFFFSYPQEGLEQSITAASRGGVAEASLRLERTGQLDIAVQSDPFPRTIALKITIGEEGPAIIVPITPTPRPTPLPTPTSTPEPTLPPLDTPSPAVTPAEQSAETELEAAGVEDGRGAGLADLLLALTAATAVAGAGFYVTRMTNEATSRALRTGLSCLVAGLVLYSAYLLYAPAAIWLRERSGVWASGWITLVGSSIPLVVTLAQSRSGSPAQQQGGTPSRKG
jgi:beta-N-acetylhexosaminidase